MAGLTYLGPNSDAIVIIDVLSFSTCVDIAVANGATVYPYRWRDASADVYATSRGAIAASCRQGTGYSLSPASLRHIPPGTRLVLSSPNGSTLSLSTGAVHTFAGYLRNADAIAQTLPQYGNRFSLIPAGERWPDGSLRFAVEDLLGAGAMIHHLPGPRKQPWLKPRFCDSVLILSPICNNAAPAENYKSAVFLRTSYSRRP